MVRGLPALSLASLRLFLRKPRLAPAILADVLRLHREELGRALPAITPERLVEPTGPYTLLLGDEGLHFNELEDLLLLKLVALLRPRAIFEIGTHRGTRTALFASQAEGATIYTLDLPPTAELSDAVTDRHMIQESKSVLGSRFRGTHWESQITQLFGDSASFDFAPYRDQMDLVYVDGSHSPDYVVSDTRNAMEMLRPGGVLVWDDYGSMRAEYGTTSHLEELQQAGFPVFRLGPPLRRAALRARGVMRVDREVLERFAKRPH